MYNPCAVGKTETAHTRGASKLEKYENNNIAAEVLLIIIAIYL